MALVVGIARAYVRYSSPIAYVARRFIREAGRLSSELGGVCVDVGAGTCPYVREVIAAFGIERYVAIDVAPTDRTTIVADARALPIKSSSVQLLVSFDVLQHVDDVERLMSEVARVLVTNGYVLLTFPFLYAECDFRDYNRWTMDGMQALLARHGLAPVLSKRRGGLAFAAACALNWALQHIIPGQRTSWRQARTPLGLVRSAFMLLLTVPTNILGWLALALDSVVSLPWPGAYMGGAVLARRVSEAQPPRTDGLRG